MSSARLLAVDRKLLAEEIQRHLIRGFLILALIVAYATLFIFCAHEVGPTIRIFAGAYVVLAAFFWGLPGGLTVAILNIAVQVALHDIVHLPMEGGPLGPISILLLGGIAGKMRDMAVDTKRELLRRLRAEEEMRKTRDLYQTVILSASDAILIMDPKSREIVDVNPAAAQMYRRTQHDLQGTSIDELSTNPETIDAILAQVRPGERRNIPLRFHRRSDGSIFPVEISIGRFNVDGRDLVCGIVRDITERHQQKIETERFRILLDHAAEAVVISDPSILGQIIDVNARASGLLGYSREELLKMRIADIEVEFPVRTQEEWISHIAQLRSAGRPVTVEGIHRRKDGSTYPAEISVSLVRFLDAEYVLGVVHDVTERRRLEADLLQSRTMAQEANRAKSLFLATMSHEIRTPLNAVLGYAELVARTNLNTEQQEMLLGLTASGSALRGLLTGLLDVSSVEAGGIRLNQEDFDLLDLIEQVRLTFAERASVAQIKLEWSVDGKTPRRVHGDRTRLLQILTNIIGNAVKFTKQGSVRVSFGLDRAASGSGLRVVVADTGIGIAEEHQDSLFSLFHRANTGLDGAGIGLYLARTIARTMGGDVTLAGSTARPPDMISKRGATFMIQVPLTVIESLAPQPRALTARSCRVLLVEDNKVNAKILEALLVGLGAQVALAASGKESLRAVSIQDFDLILLDLGLPDMEGLEVFQQMRASNVTVPIVALTAAALESDRERCLDAGMSDYAAKPIGSDGLAEILNRWCS
ncbi:MAG: PAS domain S-box protein [Spirochaetia bacterium]|nr:PAS domain S-box protein [Spirochaetia bacterium]